jgi:hypothetical protein
MLKTNTRIWNGSPFPVPNQPTPVYMQGDPDDVFDLASGLNPVFRSLVVESWGGEPGTKPGRFLVYFGTRVAVILRKATPSGHHPPNKKAAAGFPAAAIALSSSTCSLLLLHYQAFLGLVAF